MKTKAIQQTVAFDATAEEVYQALINEKRHAAFTGVAAKIDQKVDGKFSVYDGYCHGHTIELAENEKIVQAWHFAEDGWPDDHYSICTFLIEQKGNETTLNFTQTDVPEHKAAALASGWQEYYWEPLRDFLSK